jgi:nitrate/nitrite transporter NarK
LSDRLGQRRVLLISLAAAAIDVARFAVDFSQRRLAAF